MISLFFTLLHTTLAIDCSHEFVAGAEVLKTKHGVVIYQVIEESIDLHFIEVDPSFRRYGHGSFLIQEMVERAPRATEIQAFLMFEHLREWMHAHGNCTERFLATPLYKLLARNGFAHVMECESSRSGVWVNVRRTQ